ASVRQSVRSRRRGGARPRHRARGHMTPKRDRQGPSATEIKLRSDLDRARREVAKLKRDAPAAGPPGPTGDGGDASERARLLAEIEELQNARERLGKLYFQQIEENRQRLARQHDLLGALCQISGHLEIETLARQIAESIR